MKIKTKLFFPGEEKYWIKLRELSKKEVKLENQIHGMIDQKKNYEKIQKLNSALKDLKKESNKLLKERRNLRIKHESPETAEKEILVWKELSKKVEQECWFLSIEE